ncbi:hypothetical protein ACN47E_009192 [Coniothyrium glycines]
MASCLFDKRTVAQHSLPVSLIKNAMDSIFHFLSMVYLFTAADFATFAIPTTLFGIFGALSGPVLTDNSAPSVLSTVCRIPICLALIWLNLLVFNISNQRSPSAVEEDRINKPHRPIPSGRITSEAARDLCLILVPLVGLAGRYAHVEYETLLLFVAYWMYNDLAGSDSHFLVRNALIAVGYGLYSAIALRVMIGTSASLNSVGRQWLIVVVLVMFATQHICDIKDAEGDRLRGRKSAPIVLGDEVCRWSVALPIMICSSICPMFFRLGVWSYVFTLSFGGLVACRILTLRTLKADKLTWKLWALWTVLLFGLPLASNFEVLVVAWQRTAAFFCYDEACPDRFDVAAASCVAFAIEGRRLLFTQGSSKEKS